MEAEIERKREGDWHRRSQEKSNQTHQSFLFFILTLNELSQVSLLPVQIIKRWGGKRQTIAHGATKTQQQRLEKIQGNVHSWKSDALLTEMLNRSNSLPGMLESSNRARSKPLKSNRKHMTHWQESCVSHSFFPSVDDAQLSLQDFDRTDTFVETAFGSWGENASRFIGMASLLTS